MGDPTRLRQVFLNLLTNAIKFTAQGEVRLTVAAPGPEAAIGLARSLRFEVSDTGIGVAPDAVERIFHSFTQADVSTTRKYGGTGLGLAICRHLVTLMGGEIGVRSQPEKGSTFWFTFPLRPALPVLVSPVSVVAGRAAPERLRILLAEDNSVNQLIAVKMLEKLGHEVVAVADGREAVARFAAESYDLVLMDCQMPELDGYEATRKIRAGQANRAQAVPIIAMTANAMRGDREKCLEAGMSDYISKPMNQAELQSVIERAAAARRDGGGEPR